MGRKPGSLNRKTLMMMPMLEQLGYRDPAHVLAEVASMPHSRLKKLTATEAGRSALAARLKAASDLMPFCHGKLPVTLNVQRDLPEFYILGNTNQLEQDQGLKDVTPVDVGCQVVGHSADLFETIQQSEDKADD